MAFFSSCQKDDSTLPSKSGNSAQQLTPGVSYFQGQKAKEKIKHLKDVYSNLGVGSAVSRFSADSAFFKWGYIDQHRVMQVKITNDSLKETIVNTTYRIKRYENKHPNTFINLVLSENKYRITLTLYGYVMSPNFADLYLHQGYPLSAFEGVVLTQPLEISDDIKNCPVDVEAVENWKNAHQPPGGSGGGGSNVIPPGYNGPDQNHGFLSNLYGITNPGNPGNGNSGGNDSGLNLDLSWVINVGEDIGNGLGDAWQWFLNKWQDFKKWLHDGGDCDCGRSEGTNDSLELGGDGQGIILIDGGAFDEDHPENPYPDPIYFFGDRCHKFAVGILSDLYSTFFIADKLGITEADVQWMRNHPDFGIPATLFLEDNHFSEDAKAFFRPKLQEARSGVDANWKGVFVNYYIGLDESSTEYDWLVNDANNDQLDNIVNFFLGYGVDQENMDFFEEVIDAIIDGAEVDFNDPLDGYNFHSETTTILAFEPGYRDRMSQAELAIFDNLSRFQQLDYLHSAYLAKTYSEIYYEPNTLYNGKGDAYRHTLWNALGAAKLGATLMEQLASAHEGPDPGETNNPLEKAMDLHNNQIGRDIGSQSIFMLMMKVKFAVDKGQTNYISPRAPNGSVIPGVSHIIPTNQ